MVDKHPSEPLGRLKDYWSGPVSDLVQLPNPPISQEAAERHRIYSLLTLALIATYWNGNKRGATGEYPWRPLQRDAKTGLYIGGDYLGHNIAAIAVDGRGAVIDFDFNHNDLLNSSVEHAESRLVRRVFSLTHLYNKWEFSRSRPTKTTPYATVLSDVTVYTSLESCSQCSGIMALGSVRSVVFLQRDPGQNSIGNILYNLGPKGASFQPPLPIPGDLVGLDAFGQLKEGFDGFAGKVGQVPFHIDSNGHPDNSPSITSYLCTDQALEIVTRAAKDFEALRLQYPTYVPTDGNGKPIPNGLSNERALDEARNFLIYAKWEGHRGTPHKL